MNQHGLAALRFRADEEGFVGGGVGNGESRALREGRFFRQRPNLIEGAKRQLRISAAYRSGSINAIADGDGMDTITHCDDFAGRVGAGRVRQVWFCWVRARTNVKVDRVYTDGANANQYFAMRRLRRRNFDTLQDFGATE